MTVVKYPSELAPGPVNVSVDIPDGWSVESAPSVAFYAVSESSRDGIFPNVVVAVQRVSSDLALSDIAQMVRGEWASLDGCEELSARVGDVNGRETAVLSFEVDEQGETAASHQVQVLCSVPVRGSIADLVTLAITWGSQPSAAELGQIDEIIESLSVYAPPNI